MLLDIGVLFGRFHPLLVHLPIGFLIMAVVFGFLSMIKNLKPLAIAVPVALLLGFISAVFASVTGYVLSRTGDYNLETVDSHMWAGIVTTIAAFIAYLVSLKKIPIRFLKTPAALIVTLCVIIVLINVTGHLGGSLTHGEDYLTAPALFDKQRERIKNSNDAYIFADLVHPILQDKCSNCHNNSKKKGRLSMASYESLIKGGKNGTVLKPGNARSSELIKRVSLDPKHKKFMPADGKPPLTAQETAILTWWIEKVAGKPDQKFAQVNAPPEIRNYVNAYFGIQSETISQVDTMMKIQVPLVHKQIADELKQSGYIVKYLSFKPDLLDVTLPAQGKEGNVGGKLKGLLKVKDNILWLNVSENNISDNEMEIFGQFKNLERLRLNKNNVTDKGIEKIKALSNLRTINLNDTKITNACLKSLTQMPNLKTVYVWRTAVTEQDASTNAGQLKVIAGN